MHLEILSPDELDAVTLAAHSHAQVCVGSKRMQLLALTRALLATASQPAGPSRSLGEAEAQLARESLRWFLDQRFTGSAISEMADALQPEFEALATRVAGTR